jgi:hypothetical protein
MLYPKEDKENKVLLYAVSTVCIIVEGILVSFGYLQNFKSEFFSTYLLVVQFILLIVNCFSYFSVETVNISS